LAKEYLAKGRQVYIEGRIQTRNWEDKEGNKRQTTEIVAQRMQFLGSKGGGQEREAAPSGSTAGAAPVNDISSEDDDLPF
jgi:single-strand DNA-binding protein